MITKRMTANDYAKELHKLKLDEMALEKRIKARAKELCEQNPDIMIEQSCYVNSHKAKEFVIDDEIRIDYVLKIIETIEDDLVKKHPHKQTEIKFPAEELQTQLKMKCSKSPNGLHQFGFDGSTCSYCGTNVAYL